MSLPSLVFSTTASLTLSDEVDVAAAPAIHRIGTGVTVEQIVAGIAVEHVAQDVAVCLQIGAPLQDQVLYVRRQPEMGGLINRVDAVVGVFDHGVADIVLRSTTSFPAPPAMRSAFAPPFNTLLEELPMILSFPPPPIPVSMTVSRAMAMLFTAPFGAAERPGIEIDRRGRGPAGQVERVVQSAVPIVMTGCVFTVKSK